MISREASVPFIFIRERARLALGARRILERRLVERREGQAIRRAGYCANRAVAANERDATALGKAQIAPIRLK